MKIEESKQPWKPMFFVAIGFLGALVFAFTNPTAPSRHFTATAPIGLANTYAVTMSGDPNNNGIPVPGVQTLPAFGKIPTSAPSDGGTTTPYIEYGRDVMSGATKTITFKNAFAIPPACFCQDGTAITSCDVPISTISTTQMVVNGTGTDKFSWMCIGDGT